MKNITLMFTPIFSFENEKIDFNEFLVATSITLHGDENEKLKMAFSLYDIDRNGRIDKKEMKKIFEAISDLLLIENRNSATEKAEYIMDKLGYLK
jgi:Ca2+-binding EF-hand superfamily protein